MKSSSMTTAYITTSHSQKYIIWWYCARLKTRVYRRYTRKHYFLNYSTPRGVLIPPWFRLICANLWFILTFMIQSEPHIRRCVVLQSVMGCLQSLLYVSYSSRRSYFGLPRSCITPLRAISASASSKHTWLTQFSLNLVAFRVTIDALYLISKWTLKFISNNFRLILTFKLGKCYRISWWSILIIHAGNINLKIWKSWISLVVTEKPIT